MYFWTSLWEFVPLLLTDLKGVTKYCYPLLHICFDRLVLIIFLGVLICKGLRLGMRQKIQFR